MKSPSSAVAALALLCAGASSVSADSTGYIALPVHAMPPSVPARMARRQGNPVAAVLVNQQTFYSMDVSLGTPPQQVSIILDTGSSELWVDPDCRTANAAEFDQCQNAGFYNPQQSTTPPQGPFGQNTINYGDPTDTATQTSVTIEYFSDTLTIAGAAISNQTFGVVAKSQGISQGILGLGPDLSAGFTIGEPYSLVLNSMAAQGIIASRAFTLDLRSATDQSGALIFGGLDRNMFSGSLEASPLVKGLQGEFRLAADISSVSVTFSPTNSTSFSLGTSAGARACLLDSGSSLTRLQPALASQIVSALGAADDGTGYFAVDCGLLNSNTASVDFHFAGGAVVSVPMSDFLFNNGPASFGGPQVCYLAMVDTTDLQVLGDSVLRAGYFVFDWDNEAVHIAQAASCGSSDIVAISSGTNAVPSVTGNCQATSVPNPTSAAPDVPSITSSYTTILTVTSCAALDPTCQTGVVTQTGVAVSPSNAVGASPSLVRWSYGGLLTVAAVSIALLRL